MTEQTCSTCRWWVRQYQYNDGPAWGLCELTDGGDAPTHPETKAYAVDAEVYHAILTTKPDFGCNQWEEKE